MGAGIPVADKTVLWLATSVREAELLDTAEPLDHAYDREARIVALDARTGGDPARFEECPEGLLELRATLLQERVWLQREGLAWSALRDCAVPPRREVVGPG